MDMKYSIIKTWDSCRLAGRELRLFAEGISAAALGKTQYCGGFRWKYESCYEKTMKNFESEIWKPIKEYEGLYEVSSFGRIKSLIKDMILSECLVGEYHKVVLYKNGKSKLVHRLVAESFIPNKENKKFVNHTKGIKDDNRVSELEWVTQKENNIHSNNFKKILKGTEIVGSKLKNDDIIKIRELSKLLTSRKIAKIYNVNKSTILDIINNKTWLHV